MKVIQLTESQVETLSYDISDKIAKLSELISKVDEVSKKLEEKESKIIDDKFDLTKTHSEALKKSIELKSIVEDIKKLDSSNKEEYALNLEQLRELEKKALKKIGEITEKIKNLSIDLDLKKVREDLEEKLNSFMLLKIGEFEKEFEKKSLKIKDINEKMDKNTSLANESVGKIEAYNAEIQAISLKLAENSKNLKFKFNFINVFLGLALLIVGAGGGIYGFKSYQDNQVSPVKIDTVDYLDRTLKLDIRFGVSPDGKGYLNLNRQKIEGIEDIDGIRKLIIFK
jgi:DNA repair exonuclease SbcCD ATPase subunit